MKEDVAVVGAFLDNDAGTQAGAAYVFYRTQEGAHSWQQVAKLTASDGAPGDWFGRSVAVSLNNNYVVVGAPNADIQYEGEGKAYVFFRDQGGINNWGQVANLIASDHFDFNGFGYSVSIAGSNVLIGTSFSEKAYIFNRDHGGPGHWGQVKKLVGDVGSSDSFGISVAIAGDYAVVGAHDADEAWVYHRDEGGANQWGNVAKLYPRDQTEIFGKSVSIWGKRAVVGAIGDDDGGSWSGAAYVFYRDHGGEGNWGQVAKLTASDAAPNDWFGFSVSISGDTVVAGADLNSDVGALFGSAYVFRRNEGGEDLWGEVAKLSAPDPEPDDEFGFSVSASGDEVMVGMSGDDDGGGNKGSAFVFGPTEPLFSDGFESGDTSAWL